MSMPPPFWGHSFTQVVFPECRWAGFPVLFCQPESYTPLPFQSDPNFQLPTFGQYLRSLLSKVTKFCPFLYASRPEVPNCPHWPQNSAFTLFCWSADRLILLWTNFIYSCFPSLIGKYCVALTAKGFRVVVQSYSFRVVLGCFSSNLSLKTCLCVDVQITQPPSAIKQK